MQTNICEDWKRTVVLLGGTILLSLVVSMVTPLPAEAASTKTESSEFRGIAITARDAITGMDREVKLYRQLHAVVIGIDRYENLPPDQQLSYAVEDAQGIEKVLREQYSFDTFYTLYNEKATRNGIMAVLQGKLSNVHEDDGVLIFFAGHGTTQKDKLTGGELGYILPHDGTFNKDEMYLNISMGQLKDEVAKVIPAKHVFYVIDACYSGTLLAQRAGGVVPKHDFTYLQEVTKESVRQVLTAGTDKQAVLDGGPKGHSVFTGRLIEKLEETDDYITAAELGDYVKRRVASDAEARGHIQTPRDGSFYGLGDFVFVPSGNKRALEMERERKRLESELARLKEQETMMEAAKVQQQREELERQKKALEAKQKIEELRRAVIVEAKRREDERVGQELEAKKQEEMRKKQDEERLASLKREIEKKRLTVPEVPAGQFGVDQAIMRIKDLQSELSEIESKISEAVNQVRRGYDQRLREAEPGAKGEFQSTAEYQQLVTAAEQKKEKVRHEQSRAGEIVREKALRDVETIRKVLKELLTAEYPIPPEKMAVELGQFDADKQEMGVQIRWTTNMGEYTNDGYIRIDSSAAKRVKDHREFVKAKGWVYIVPQILRPALLRIDIVDEAENGWFTPVNCGFRGAIGMVGSYILRFDGTVWTWESGIRERAPIPEYAGLSHVSVISDGLALKEDGTVWTLGGNVPVQVPSLTHVMAIAGASYWGEGYRLALKFDGTVWAWRDQWRVNTSGNTRKGTKSALKTTIPVQVPSLTGVKAIAAGGNEAHGSKSTLVLAVKEDGTVWEWKPSAGTSPIQVPSLINVRGMATGSRNCLAVNEDGTVWEWGKAESSQGCGEGHNIPPVLAPNLAHVVAVVSLDAYYRYKVALKNDGTVWAWINDTLYKPLEQIPSLGNIIAIAPGGDGVLALKDDGTVWTWGWPYGGGAMGERTTPARIPAPIQVDPVRTTETSGTGTGKVNVKKRR